MTKTRRWMFFVLVGLCIAFFHQSAEAAYKPTEITKMVGLKEFTFETRPFTEDEYPSADSLFMIPLREAAEKLGFEVTWEKPGRVRIRKGYVRASLIVGKNEYFDRNDRQVNMDVLPILKDGKTYVPHTFFDKVLGFDTFVLDDALYLRTRIDGVRSKLYHAPEKIDKRFVDMIYPELTAKSEGAEAFNASIRRQLLFMIESIRFDSMYAKYDIGILTDDIFSVILSGEYELDGVRHPFFNSINFDMRSKKEIRPSDVFASSSDVRAYLTREVESSMQERFRMGLTFQSLKMYFVSDAIILYSGYIGDPPALYSKFFKIDDIRPILRSDYADIFRKKSETKE